MLVQLVRTHVATLSYDDDILLSRYIKAAGAILHCPHQNKLIFRDHMQYNIILILTII